MITTPNLSLIAWNQPSDAYSSDELAENWIKVDQHDHTEGKGARITSGAIEDQAITPAKLHPDSLPDLSIPDDSISTAKIQNLAVTTGKINSNAVTSGKLGTGAVETDKIADDAVTRAKVPKTFIQVATGSVTSSSNKTITWGTAFPNTNYVVAVGFQSGSSSIYPWQIESKTTTQVQLRASYLLTGTIHIIGIAI